MVAPIRYLSRRIQEQKIGILQNTEEEKVLEVIGRVGIGTTIFDAEYSLDVRGTANVSGILSVGQIISGAGNTFSDLTVTGDTDLQSDVIIGGGLTVTGVSTFTSDLDINASIDVSNDVVVGSGLTNETGLFIRGNDTTTYTSTGSGSGYPNSYIGLEIRNESGGFGVGQDASALMRFSANNNGGFYNWWYAGSIATADANRAGNFVIGSRDGGPEWSERLRIDASGNVGIGTDNPSQKLDVNGNVNIRGELHGPEIFIIDPAAVGDNTGAVRIKGDLYVDGTEFIVDSENILLADYRVGIATTVATNLLLDGAGISIGATNIEKTFTYNNTANTLESSIGLGVTEGGEFKTGTDSVLNRTTLGPTVVNSSLTNLGTLTELNVSGVSTFIGAIDANGDLDVDGHTELDDLNVSGVSTFSNNVDINATAEINTLNVSLLSNFSGDVDVNASLDIQDNLTVTGLSSFFSNVDITGDLDVDGHTELDDLNVSGVSTFSGAADFNGDIDVDGHTELDDLNVSGVSTFAGDVSIADKITHIGDTDTAIRFPAADTFTVETAGTERLRVTSAGNVGIGTDNPQAQFHILAQPSVSANTSFLRFYEQGNAAGLNTTYGTSGGVLALSGYFHDNVPGRELAFFINNSGIAKIQTSDNSPLRIGSKQIDAISINIDGGGNPRVGINTTAPSQTLDVNGDVRFRDKIFDSTGDSGVANYVLASGGPGSPWSWKLVADVGAGILDAIFVRQDGSDVGAAGTNTTLDFYENFSLTQPVAGIASVRLSDDINISGILTVGQLNINDTAGISTVISYDAVDQQRELQNIVIDCGTY